MKSLAGVASESIGNRDQQDVCLPMPYLGIVSGEGTGRLATGLVPVKSLGYRLGCRSAFGGAFKFLFFSD